MNRTFALDLGERVVATFVEGAVATVPVTALFTDAGGWKVAGLSMVGGGFAAVAALVKGWAAKQIGNPDSAALISPPVPAVTAGRHRPLPPPVNPPANPLGEPGL